MTIKNAVEAIEFYTKAFGAEELLRLTGPGDSMPPIQSATARAAAASR